MKTYSEELAQIGSRICARRSQLGLSGIELAEKSGISVSTLSNVENGQRNISVNSLCALARALEVPLARLQPEDLDAFTEQDPRMRDLQRKLNQLSDSQKSLMLNMFNGQLDTLLSASDEKYYHR